MSKWKRRNKLDAFCLIHVCRTAVDFPHSLRSFGSLYLYWMYSKMSLSLSTNRGSPAIPAINTISKITFGWSYKVKQRSVTCSWQRLTSDTKWPNGVLVQSEALLQSVCPHVLIKDVTSSEIQNSTVVLVLGN